MVGKILRQPQESYPLVYTLYTLWSLSVSMSCECDRLVTPMIR